jgi:hypothetical protein
MINSDGFQAMVKSAAVRMDNSEAQRFAYEIRTKGAGGVVVGNTVTGLRAAQFAGKTAVYPIASLATLPRADRLALIKSAIDASNADLAFAIAGTLDAKVVARATAALNRQ